MAGCGGCGNNGGPDKATVQPPGNNPGPIIELDFDRAIHFSVLVHNMVEWMTRYNIKPCECEKDKELKTNLEAIRKNIDFVLERI